MKTEEKQKAIELRMKGLSLREIVKELGVSKGSVSLWVRDVKLSKKKQLQLSKNSFSFVAIEKRRQSRLCNERNKRDVIIKKAEEDFDNISDKELKILGTMLYWAEGGKTVRGMVRFSNSNPEMIKVMMCFFRKICLVPEGKFKGHIHTHSKSNVCEAEEYWSGVTKIPKGQFFKTYFKQSSSSQNKRKTLPYGTFDIYICDTKLFLTIMGWLNKISNLTLDIYE